MAFLGSWEQCLSEVAGESALETMDGFWETALASLWDLKLAEASLREQGAKRQADWEKCLAGSLRKRQEAWTKEVHEAMREHLLAQLDG